MNEQQDRKKRAARKPREGKSSQKDELPLHPQPGSPMDKLNNALRKILSVPKKNIKDK